MKATLFACLTAVLLSTVHVGHTLESATADQEKLNKRSDKQKQWKIHDMDRPLPPVVDPGPPQLPLPAPSDAVVLFDGDNLNEWQDSNGQPAGWKVENGCMEVVKGTGNIQTVRSFGDCQVHLEWRAPTRDEWEGEKLWGNSGVYFMGLYEVQILDSVSNRNYADGVVASVYGQYPPLVIACRPPGEWQTFDIIFHGPCFNEGGELIHPATMTVFHNSILVQDDVRLTGPTAHGKQPPYKAHPERLPLMLQNYNEPIRFRNIWIREITSLK